MRFKSIFLVITAIITFSSCDENQIVIDSDNLLIGNWLEPYFNGETTTFKRGTSLPNEAYGIKFTQNGDFIERSSGWCGTPPLIFSDYKGSYTLEDTLIKISTSNFPNNFQWRIISITETELVVKRELSEQEIEHRSLMTLFNEIQNLAYSVSCSNSSNWLFTAYGAKACGGPQGYISYSNQIDTVAFLQKVEIYTQAEKDFNYKWGIISDCSVTNTPKSIECVNGYPKFNY